MMHAWRTGLHKKTDTLILSAANARMCKAAKDAQKVLDSEKSQASNR